jgi:hypothetical protein
MSQGSHQASGNKPGFSFNSAFWVVFILAGVFICALNFIKVMGSEGGEGKEGKEGAKTEVAAPAKDESKTEKPADAAPKTDAPKAEKH